MVRYDILSPRDIIEYRFAIDGQGRHLQPEDRWYVCACTNG
jgi:hypothetical protein